MRKALAAILLLAGGVYVSEPLAAAKFSGRALMLTAVTSAVPGSLDVEDEWRTVPGMVVEFTTTKSGPAVATFCAEARSSSIRFIVRLREAGVGNWEPGPVPFLLDSFYFDVRCFSWFATLPPGTYKIKAQWLTYDPGFNQVQRRSLRVQHQN